MYRFILAGFFIFSTIRSIASHDNTPAGGRSSALGNTSLCFADVWSVHNNQAAMAFLNKPAAGLYFENKFLVKELNLQAGAAVLPTKSGVFGLSLSYYGNKLYSEGKTGLAYAKNFGQRFSAGIQLDYLFTRIAENYGTRHSFTFEIGLLGRITKNLTLAAHVFNPIIIKLADYNNERIPAIIRLGILYNFSENLLVTMEAEEKISLKPGVNAGIEYRLLKKAFIRIGLSASDHMLYSFGFGLEVKNMNMDIAAAYHPVLGISPKASLVFTFKP
jgi:hypothetical protein